jgi:RNA recognition motif-containing protein
MELFIGNIPDDVDDYDLRKFFHVVGEQASFKIVTREGGHYKAYRYGLASFDSDKLARQVIKRFNGMLFKDKRVVVREFSHRNYSNDRRALNWRQAEWDKTERRGRDRRGSMIRRHTAANEGVAASKLG